MRRFFDRPDLFGPAISLFTTLLLLEFSPSLAHAADPNSTRLTKADIKQKLQQRIDSLSNIYIKCTTRQVTAKASLLPEKIDPTEPVMSEWNYMFFKTAEKYRYSCQDFMHSQDRPLSFSEQSYDYRTGISRGFSTHRDLEQRYGHILPFEAGALDNFDCGASFLSTYGKTNRAIFYMLLRHFDEYSIVETSNPSLIRLVRTPPRDPNDALVASTIDIDLERGFTPILWRRDCELTSDRTFKFFMLMQMTPLKKFGNTWFPQRIVKYDFPTSQKRETVVVTETIVEDLKVGTVTDQDVAFSFPDDVVISNNITGTMEGAPPIPRQRRIP